VSGPWPEGGWPHRVGTSPDRSLLPVNTVRPPLPILRLVGVFIFDFAIVFIVVFGLAIILGLVVGNTIIEELDGNLYLGFLVILGLDLDGSMTLYHFLKSIII
jgi:hypothetical protein